MKVLKIAILILSLSAKSLFAQNVEKAFVTNNIKKLDAGMEKYSSSAENNTTDAVDSVMTSLIYYMSKKEKELFKTGKYKFFQKAVHSVHSDSLNFAEKYLSKLYDQNEVGREPSDAKEKEYRFMGEEKFFFFVPQTIISKFNEFLSGEADRKKFLEKRILLSSETFKFRVKGGYDTKKKCTYTFFVDSIVFNRNKHTAAIFIKTFKLGTRGDVIIMSSRNNVWEVVSRKNISNID